MLCELNTTRTLTQKKIVFPFTYTRMTATKITGHKLQSIMIVIIHKLGIIMRGLKTNVKKTSSTIFKKEKSMTNIRRDAINTTAKMMLLLLVG